MLIELDLREAEQPAESPAYRLGRSYRSWAAVIVLSAVLLGVGAAAPTPDDGLREIAVLSGAGEQMLALDQVLITFTDRRASAFDPATGERRWQTDIGGNPFWSLRLGGHLLLTVGSPEAAHPGIISGLVRLDVATGERVDLPVTGFPNRITDRLIAVQPTPGQVGAGVGTHGADLTVYDVLDNRVVWTLPDPGAWTLSEDGSRIYRLADRVLTDRDAVTGVISRKAVLDIPVAGRASLMVQGEQLIVQTGWVIDANGFSVYEADGAPLTAIDIESMTVAPRPPDLLQFVADCGDVLCRMDAGASTVLDGRTREVLWSAPPGQSLLPVGQGLLATSAGQHPFGSALHRLVEARTGAQVADLGGWVGLRQSINGSHSAGEVALLLRPRPKGVTFLGDIHRGRVRTLGRLDFTVAGCAFTDRYLACADDDTAVHLLRLPAAVAAAAPESRRLP
jgi:hypothetical protein